MTTTHDPFFNPLVEKMHRELVKYLVGKAITCPRSGAVLDYRTCVVFLDTDGDPTAVMSPDGYADMIVTQPDTLPWLSEKGITPDPNTVPKS